MSLDTVTLSWDLTDLIESGLSATLSITPTAQMSDSADHVLIPPVARAYSFSGGAGSLAGIIANDNENILPAGTGYLISVTAANGQVIVPQFQTQLLSADADDDGVLWLDALAVVPSVTTTYQYLPLTTGTPAEGQVPVFTGDGYATEPGDPGGGGGGSGTVTSVSVATANGFAGTVADETTTPAISVKLGFTSGLVKAGTGGAASAATAGTDYLPPAGSGAALTGITAAQVGADASGAAAGVQTNLTAEVSRAEAAEALALQQASNLSDLASASTARANLGLGTAATQNSSAFDEDGAAATAQSDAETFATGAVATETTRAETAEALLAPLASPALTGTPTAPTQTALNNSTRLATTAYADAAVAVETSRAEAAEALKAPLASPALTGSPTAPTQTTGDSSTKVATDAFVATAVATETTRAETAEALLAPKASPALTGTPTAPTASALTDSTQVATTAYADAAVAVETTRAESAEGTLTTAVAGKVAKSGDTMTGGLSPTVTAVAFASTVTLPVTTNVLSLTLTGACTVNAPSSGNDGFVLRVRIIGANSHAVTWGTGWDWGTAGAPTLAGPRDRIVAEYVASATVWDAAADLGHG